MINKVAILTATTLANLETEINDALRHFGNDTEIVDIKFMEVNNVPMTNTVKRPFAAMIIYKLP